MLKGIPPIISPELLKIIMEMGHGDEIVIADGNFPSASIANKLIRMDGHGVQPILEAILQLLPLDPYVENPVALMQKVPGDTIATPIWETYRASIKSSSESDKFTNFEYVERFEFYERAKKAYAVIATSEPALYANIILKKGCV
ncbi:MAG: fucose isomerase [Phycisphaerae bacterium]|nr:fucose isomerase [Phycisphaerae bacterium]